MPFLIKQRVDLYAQMSVLSLSAPFQYGDALAHEWQVDVVRNGNAVDLTGYTINLYCRRADNSTVGPLTGTAGNGRASIVFPAAVYNVVGDAVLLLRAEKAASGANPAETVTLAALHVRISRDTTDTIASEEVIVPNINELLSQIAAMEAGTSAANTAAGAANTAAGAANTAAAAANTAAELANTKAALADEKAGAANTAAGAANTAASAAENITQQIMDGIIPQLSIGTVETVAPNVSAEVTLTGTTRAPVLNFKIPRGTGGESSVERVGGVAPDLNGNIPLTVAGVGAETDPTDPDYGNIPLTPGDIGAVPSTRTVNGKTLSSDITLDANDVGALPSTEPHLQNVTRYHIATNGSGSWTYEKYSNTTYSYAQTISVQGVAADDVASVSFDTSQVTLTNYGTMQENFMRLWCVEMAANSVIVHCRSMVTIPILLEVIR